MEWGPDIPETRLHFIMAKVSRGQVSPPPFFLLPLLASSTFFAHPRSKFPFFSPGPARCGFNIHRATLPSDTAWDIWLALSICSVRVYLAGCIRACRGRHNERNFFGFLVQKITRKSFLLQKNYRTLSQVTMCANLAASFAHNMCKLYISFLVLTLVVARVKL